MPVALAMPTLRTCSPFMLCSMKPKVYSGPGPYFRFLLVALLLPFVQGLATAAPLMYAVVHPVSGYGFFLVGAGVGTVAPKVLAPCRLRPIARQGPASRAPC